MVAVDARAELNTALPFILCLVLSLAITAGLFAQAGAHSGDRVYPIPGLTDEMLAQIRLDDGLVDEWYDLIGEPTLTLLDFQDPYNQPDPSNLDFRIWLAWHDDPDRLYFAFIGSDDVYRNNHNYNSDDYHQYSIILSQDSINLAVDGDHSGGEGGVNSTPVEEWAFFHGQTQLYEAIARTVSGPTLNDRFVLFHTGNFAWTIFPPFGDGGGGVHGENPTISVIELYVTPYDSWEGLGSSPEETVFSDLTAGQVIGFALTVHDTDEEEYWTSWTPEAIQTEEPEIDIEKYRADVYLDGLLLPADPTVTEEDTAVESVTWGRIKAALEINPLE